MDAIMVRKTASDGAQLATGTITCASGITQIAITGLDFTPEFICVYLASGSIDAPSGSGGYKGRVINSTWTTSPYNQATYKSCYDDDSDPTAIFSMAASITYTVVQGGFTADVGSMAKIASRSYYWMAIG